MKSEHKIRPVQAVAAGSNSTKRAAFCCLTVDTFCIISAFNRQGENIADTHSLASSAALRVSRVTHHRRMTYGVPASGLGSMQEDSADVQVKTRDITPAQAIASSLDLLTCRAGSNKFEVQGRSNLAPKLEHPEQKSEKMKHVPSRSLPTFSKRMSKASILPLRSPTAAINDHFCLRRRPVSCAHFATDG